MPQGNDAVKKLLCLRILCLVGYSAVCLVGCSSVRTWKLENARVEEPIFTRGWNFVEPEKEFLDMGAGLYFSSYSGPVLQDNKIIFGSERFGLVAVNKKNGKELWRKNFPHGVDAVPLVVQNKIYVGTNDGGLHLIDLDHGSQSWETSLGAPVQGTMLLAQDRLFVATSDDAVHGIDPQTGKSLWRYKRPASGLTGIHGGGNPSFIAGKIWMGFSDGYVVTLEPQDGSVSWEKQFRDNVKFFDIDAKIIGWHDGVLLTTYDGKLRYLKKDGTLIWDFAAGGAHAPLITEDDQLYLPSSNGNVYAINSSGKEIWHYTMNHGTPTSVALVPRKSGGDLLVVGSSDRKIFGLDAKTGSLLGEASLGRGSGSFAPLVADKETHSFYVLSSFSRLYQFKVRQN